MNQEEKDLEVQHNSQEQLEEQQNQQSETDQEIFNTEAITDTVSKIEFDELYQKYLRLYSDFDNYKKRALKERAELMQTATREVFKTIIPVLDDFDRAAKAIEIATNLDEVKEGISLIQNKFLTTLGARGLKAMETIGTVFDADIHEAIANIDAIDPSQKGQIIDEIEKGYYLNEKVLRFAKVIVANK